MGGPQVLVLIAALSQIGVQTTSLLAVLGTAGLAIGLALQGALSNVAAGVMLLILRPYRIGDFVRLGHAAEAHLAAARPDGWMQPWTRVSRSSARP